MTHRNYRHDPQGTLLGMPYDWRLPTPSRIAARIANPRGGMFSPKVFGWGYTLNLAHRGSWLLIGGVLAAAAICAGIMGAIGC
ncbi:MAG TPA: hypothetical protein ENK57_09565 [Polyangiaceae bacterium]|nr:hypothetical protein [Polyangiaceae bacterium]